MHEEKTLVFRLEVLFVALRLSRAGFTARPETRSTPGAACARAVKEPMRFTCQRRGGGQPGEMIPKESSDGEENLTGM